jgi:hypothetical protein
MSGLWSNRLALWFLPVFWRSDVRAAKGSRLVLKLFDESGDRRGTCFGSTLHLNPGTGRTRWLRILTMTPKLGVEVDAL